MEQEKARLVEPVVKLNRSKAMKDVEMPCVYHDTGVSRFAGNPFIEAMPPLEQSKSDFFLTNLAHYPAKLSATLAGVARSFGLMELSDYQRHRSRSFLNIKRLASPWPRWPATLM